MEERAASLSWKLGGHSLSMDMSSTTRSGQNTDMSGFEERGKKKDKMRTQQTDAGQFSDWLLSTGGGVGGGGGGGKQVILDMRGPLPSYITDTTMLQQAPQHVDSGGGGGLCVELLYNVNMVVDLTEMNVSNMEKKLAHLERTMEGIQTTMEGFERGGTGGEEGDRLEHMVVMEKVLQKMIVGIEKYQDMSQTQRRFYPDTTTTTHKSSKAAQATGDITDTSILASPPTLSPTAPPITRDHIVNGIHKLLTLYPEECVLVGLLDVLPSLTEPFLVRDLSVKWDMVHSPMGVVDVYIDWKMAFALVDISPEGGPGEETLDTQTFSSRALQGMFDTHVAPRLSSYIRNEWDVTDVPEVTTCVGVIRGVKGILSADVFRSVVDMSVLPRLTSAVENWNPMVAMTPIDAWVIPWVSVLGTATSVLFPTIRRKIVKALSHWQATDTSAYYILLPWKGVFDNTSFEQCVVRHILPKLVHALRSQEIEPTGQHTTIVTSVFLWRDLLPTSHFIALLQGEFFPRWFKVLVDWLRCPSVNMAEISVWYSEWKALFPDEIVSDPTITGYFSCALDMMSSAMTYHLSPTHEDMPVFEIPEELSGRDVSYFRIIEHRRVSEMTRRRLEELRRGEPHFVLPQGAPRSHTSSTTSNSSGYGRVESHESSYPPPTPDSPFSRPHHSHVKSYDVSFRDVVEEFAARNGVTFTPKLTSTGQVVEVDGKAIWVFADKIACYIDQNVVFARVGGNSGGTAGVVWKPLSLESLLELAQ